VGSSIPPNPITEECQKQTITTTTTRGPLNKLLQLNSEKALQKNQRHWAFKKSHPKKNKRYSSIAYKVTRHFLSTKKKKKLGEN
jgi:hypothetical protein